MDSSSEEVGIGRVTTMDWSTGLSRELGCRSRTYLTVCWSSGDPLTPPRLRLFMAD